MENIDDLMRQKFDADDSTERFEFQEDYWEQAQALLAQDEARRRRRFWLLIGLMLGVVLFSWYVVVHWFSGSLSQNKAGAGDMNTTAVKIESATESKLATEGIALDTATLVGDTVGGNVMQGVKSSKNEDEYPRELASSKSNQYRVEISDGIKTGNTGKSLGVENANPMDNALRDSLQRSNESLINDKPVSSQPNLEQTDTRQFIPIWYLPIPISTIPLPERMFDLRRPAVSQEPIATLTKPVEKPRFSFGLSLAGAAYQPSDSNSRWAGWAIGAYGNYQLNKNLSLMLGIQERFIPGYGASEDSANPVQTNQLRYSFGYERETLRRETRGLHSLEIPISARWHKGRWAVEAGGAAGMLFLIQNRTKRTIETSLEAPKTEIKRRVNGNTESYNRTYFSAFAGAEYRLNNRLSVMGRGQYQFKPVFNTVVNGIKNKGLGNVDVGLRIRLF